MDQTTAVLDQIKLTWTPIVWNAKQEPIAWRSPDGRERVYLEDIEEMSLEQLSQLADTTTKPS